MSNQAETDAIVAVQVGDWRFLRAMVEDEGWDAGLILEYLEKPWKWATEYVAWRDAAIVRDPESWQAVAREGRRFA